MIFEILAATGAGLLLLAMFLGVCVALLALWVKMGPAMGHAPHALLLFALVLLMLNFVPLPCATYDYHNPEPGFGVVWAPAAYYEFVKDYHRCAGWAKPRSLRCLSILAGVHLALAAILTTLFVAVTPTVSRKDWAKMRRERDLPARDPPMPIGSLIATIIIAVVLAIIILVSAPMPLRTRSTSAQNACINNLRQIDSAKEQAVYSKRWTGTGVVPSAIANEFIKGNTTPLCPRGGTYRYGAAGELPTCDWAGTTTHKLKD